MPAKSAILETMQFGLINTRDPINTTSDQRYIISYQYAGTAEPADIPSTGRGETGYTDFTAREKSAFAAALEHIESFLNIEFTKVVGEEDPDLNVSKIYIPGSIIGTGGPAITFYGETDIASWDGYVHYDNTLDLSDSPQMSLLLHELGHALGLDHPNSDPNSENNKTTVMSYADNPDNGMRSDGMQKYDMYALQDIWGAASNNAGNTTYRGPRNDTVDTVWDSGGKDVFNATGRTSEVRLDLREGSYSTFDTTRDVAIAYGTRIENAKGGSQADTLIGNSSKNLLLGNGGDDTLKGGGGRDTLKGGKGDDVLMGQNGNDKLFGGSGADKFVFKRNDDKDKVKGFEDDIDTLQIKGHGSVSDVMDKALDVSWNVVFEFDNGDMITVFNMTKAYLSDDVVV